MGGLRNNRQDQVQHSDIETGVGKGQALGVALHRQKIDGPNPRQGLAQHGAIEIKANVMMLGRQMRQIQPGANAGEQGSAGFARQSIQAAFASGLRRTPDRRVVERGNQRVTVLQAQCSTLGMASVNSGISASKWVPSSATIWYVPFIVPTGVVSAEPLEY